MGTKALVSLAIWLTAMAIPIVVAESATGVEASVAVRLPFDQPRPSQGDTVIVREGDHLWKIARRHLEEVIGAAVTGGQIARYWRSLIDHNIDRLRSGDPDLIYPGEVIVLPASEVSGQP